MGFKKGKWLSQTDIKIVILEINALAIQIEKCYSDLPNEAKSRAIQLAHSLSLLKNSISPFAANECHPTLARRGALHDAHPVVADPPERG